MPSIEFTCEYGTAQIIDELEVELIKKRPPWSGLDPSLHSATADPNFVLYKTECVLHVQKIIVGLAACGTPVMDGSRHVACSCILLAEHCGVHCRDLDRPDLSCQPQIKAVDESAVTGVTVRCRRDEIETRTFSNLWWHSSPRACPAECSPLPFIGEYNAKQPPPRSTCCVFL